MRIGIDARSLIGPYRTGIGKFLQGILDALARGDRGHELILYSPKPLAYDLPGPRWRRRLFRGVKGTNGQLWMQLYLWRLAQEDGIDAFWGPAFHLPVLLSRRIPALVTVHDLVHILYPHTMEMRNYIGLRALLQPSLRRAQHISADSRCTAEDLHRHLGVPLDRISVIYPGVAPGFAPRDPEEARRRMAAALGITGPYLLAVSTLEPRKNLITLIRALAGMPASFRRAWPLVVAGPWGWKHVALAEAARQMVEEGTVRFLGYVPDADLPWLYAGAVLLAFPSLYEGFGIPVVEAMATGVPVIASDIPVMREVAGEAAVYVAPTSAQDWGRALERLVENAHLRENLRARGLQRALQFSFERSAAQLMTILERLASSRPISDMAAGRKLA